MRKQSLLLCFGLFGFFIVSSNLNGQNFKSLTDKAKGKIGGATGSGTSESQSSASSSSSIMVDEAFDKYITEKYNLIFERVEINGRERKSPLDYYYFKDGIDGMLLKQQALALNYDEVAKKLKEKGKSRTSLPDKYDAVLNYPQMFKSKYDAEIAPEINKSIEKGLSEKQQKNSYAAITELDKAQGIVDVCLMFAPELDAKVKAYRDEIAANLEPLKNSYYSKIFANDFHKNNAGKIVFSKQPIVVGQENPANFTNSFTANDNIYAMVYMPATIKELSNGTPAMYYIKWDGDPDGRSYTNMQFGHNEQDYGNAFNYIDVVPLPDKAFHANEATLFADMFGKLSPRKHTFHIEYITNYKTICSGDFEIDLTGWDVEKMNANAALACSKAQDNWARNVQLPKVFSEKSVKFTNPELSDANLKAVFMKATPNCTQIVKMVVASDASTGDWTLVKNDLDIPVVKRSNNWIGMVYKANDGWCYYMVPLYYKKDYAGAGTYEKVRLGDDGAVPVKMDCVNVK